MPVSYRNPEYSAIFADRARVLAQIRSDSRVLQATKVHYRENPWDFIRDWGMTFEPRNIERRLISSIPFIPWPRQVEYLQWLYVMWRSSERGLAEKSRDCGVTWLSVGFAVSMFLFEPGFTIGFGSRKEELVDKLGDSKSIFEKLRFFIANIPIDYLPAGWDWKTCSANMRIINPETGASITGEGGDNIGRGGRTSMYLVDESAFVEHQDTVDAALSQNTNCQIDVSTVNGTGNAFYKKRQRYNNTNKVFIFDWRQDPRKDDAWYQKQKEDLDPVIIAQEIDRDYNASQEDAFIPAKWVAAAIDAHVKLGFSPSGIRATGFDPADVGDAKAIINRHGSVITEADTKTEGDITHAIPWAFEHADNFRADVLGYDGDGMGAPSIKLAMQGKAAGRMRIVAYRGSAGVLEPDETVKSAARRYREANAVQTEDSLFDTEKTNRDTYENFRAQTATWLRERFELTYIAIERVKQGFPVNVNFDDLISIDSSCKKMFELQAELSRPRRIFTKNGKIIVESKKEMKARGVQSPNLFDGTVIAFAMRQPQEKPKTDDRIFEHNVRDRTIGL